MGMNKNRLSLSIITVLIIIGVGVVLWLNPLVTQRTKEYGNKIAEGFPADFPGDSNIIEVLKNQKISSLTGSTEFILEYLTTKPPVQIFQNITDYALSKNLNSTYNGSGTDDEENSYFYLIAENSDKTERISVKVTSLPETDIGIYLIEIGILNK